MNNCYSSLNGSPLQKSSEKLQNDKRKYAMSKQQNKTTDEQCQCGHVESGNFVFYLTGSYDGCQVSSSSRVDGPAGDAAVGLRRTVVSRRRGRPRPMAHQRPTSTDGALLLGCGGCGSNGRQVRSLRHGHVQRQSSWSGELCHGRLHSAVPIHFRLRKLQTTVHGRFRSVYMP